MVEHLAYGGTIHPTCVSKSTIEHVQTRNKKEEDEQKQHKTTNK